MGAQACGSGGHRRRNGPPERRSEPNPRNLGGQPGSLDRNAGLRCRDSVAHARNNYNVPARRCDALGYFVPAEETLGCDVTVYVDTSGSVSAEQLQIAVSEIAELLALCAYRVRWLEGDAAVLKDEWISAVPEMVAGGGGTSFVPLFEHLRFSRPRP